MPRFQVSTRGGDHITVIAGNWLTALGLGLDQLGGVTGLDRLACEVLANGTVIARDARSGTGFVVQEQSPDAASSGAELPRPPHEIAPMLPLSSVEMLDEDEAAADEQEDEDEADEIFALEADTGSVTPAPIREVDTADIQDGAVLQLFAAIRSAPLPATAWETAIEVAQELVPCEAGSALQLEPGGALRFMASTGPEATKLAGVTLPPGKGVVSFCVSRRLGIIVTDAAADRRFYREMDEATGFVTRRILCVPVLSPYRTWGCLQLLNPPEGQTFGKADLDQLEGLTRALADRLAALSGD